METKVKSPRKTHKIFIVVQVISILVIASVLLILYPRARLELEGNKVNFNSINANIIILSVNPDFSNPRYIDIYENVSFNLKPGKYYWKAGNGIIEGLGKEFEIDSEIGLRILEKNNSYELQNVGNVKINVTKTKEGGFVGHIILEPEEGEEIDNTGEFVGRQD